MPWSWLPIVWAGTSMSRPRNLWYAWSIALTERRRTCFHLGSLRRVTSQSQRCSLPRDKPKTAQVNVEELEASAVSTRTDTASAGIALSLISHGRSEEGRGGEEGG